MQGDIDGEATLSELPGNAPARKLGTMLPTCFLIRPTEAYRDSYLEALREGFNFTSPTPLDATAIDLIEAEFTRYLWTLDHWGQTRVSYRDREFPSVPSNSFWLVDRSQFIGAVSIRSRIDIPILARFSGHIGFGVRPSLRRRGYGRRQLALALDVCRGMGLGVVRLSCGEDNLGSRRAIEKNGGALLRRCPPDWYVDAPFLLYEIILI